MPILEGGVFCSPLPPIPISSRAPVLFPLLPPPRRAAPPELHTGKRLPLSRTERSGGGENSRLIPRIAAVIIAASLSLRTPIQRGSAIGFAKAFLSCSGAEHALRAHLLLSISPPKTRLTPRASVCIGINCTMIGTNRCENENHPAKVGCLAYSVFAQNRSLAL